MNSKIICTTNILLYVSANQIKNTWLHTSSAPNDALRLARSSLISSTLRGSGGGGIVSRSSVDSCINFQIQL